MRHTSTTSRIRPAAGALLCAGMLALVAGCGQGSSAAQSTSATSASSAASASASSATSASTATSASSATSASVGTSGPSTGSAEVDVSTTDQMWNKDVTDAEVIVAQIDGRVFTVPGFDEVGSGLVTEQSRDGGFFRIVADVTYLNGGVAGYVDYPEIHEVKKVEEVAPTEIGLPSVKDARYGFLLIGDYADGDVLLNEHGMAAVWKDGAWIWRYDKQISLDDGRDALVRKDVTAQDVQAGADSGVLASENYFVLPANA